MELDDFKTAWQTLDRRLAQQQALSLDAMRERKLKKARSGMRALVWGQIAQIVIAVVLAVLSATFWIDHRGSWHLLAAGLILHVYSIVMIISAAYFVCG